MPPIQGTLNRLATMNNTSLTIDQIENINIGENIGAAISINSSNSSAISAFDLSVDNINDAPTGTVITVASIENKEPGDEISVAISINTDTPDAISALDLVFRFDANQLEPLTQAVSSGALTQSWGTPVANTRQDQITVSQASSSPLSANTGEILILNFRIKEEVAGTIPIDLDEDLSFIMEGEIAYTAIDGIILLSSSGSDPVNSSPTGTITITGNATQGETLTADTSAIADDDGLGSFSYQWSADGTPIDGATASTYVLTQAEVGKNITVTASYIDGHGHGESLASASTSSVDNINDAPTGTVTITGNATQGETLTADISAIADDDGLGSFSYQWSADGTPIDGATASTYLLTQAEVGKDITVTASYTDGYGQSESLTAVISTITDSDSDGFTDGSESSAYQIFNDGNPITLTKPSGATFSDGTNAQWDAIKAVPIDSGFQILLKGTSARDGEFQVWTTNSSGVAKKYSGWKTIAQAHELNWESIFGDLIQPDGIIGTQMPIQL